MENINYYLDQKKTNKIIGMSILMVIISVLIILFGMFVIDYSISKVMIIICGVIGFLFFGKALMVYITRITAKPAKPILTITDSYIIDHATVFNSKQIYWSQISDIGLIQYNNSYFIGIKLKDLDTYKNDLNFWYKFNVWYNKRVGLGDLTIQINSIDETEENIFKCIEERYIYVNNLSIDRS